MIVAQSQIHDRLDDNLTVYDDWSVLNRVHAEYAALWRVDDRGAQQRSVDATVGDGKGATFKVGQSQFAGVGLDGEIGNLLLDFGKGQLVCVTQNRHDQTAVGADSDADIVIVVIDNIAAVDARIDSWKFLQGLNAGFDEERHHAQLDAMLLCELLLVPFANLFDPRHIRFIKCRQHGGLLAGLKQACRNALSNRSHGLTGNRPVIAICFCLYRGALRLLGLSLRSSGFVVGEYIIQNDPPIATAAGDLLQVNATFFGLLARRRVRRRL